MNVIIFSDFKYKYRTMKRVLLRQPKDLQPWEIGEISRLHNALKKEEANVEFEIVSEESEADIVVLLESCSFKTWKDIHDYEEMLKFYTTRNVQFFVVNYEDVPPGFLPGIYTSLESYRFNPRIHRSWPALKMPNEKIEDNCIDKADRRTPTFLFCFFGSCSHSLRRRLFNFYEGDSDIYLIREINKWYNHNEKEKVEYQDAILDSYFVLCPRGIASYSHRIIETMALGRVPVIIGDDWVPFSIPENNYYIRVLEGDIYDLPNILKSHLKDYDLLREEVIEVYAKYFSARVKYSKLINEIVVLSCSFDYFKQTAELVDLWSSRKFWRLNGWLFEQRIVRKCKKILRLGKKVSKR